MSPRKTPNPPGRGDPGDEPVESGPVSWPAPAPTGSRPKSRANPNRAVTRASSDLSNQLDAHAAESVIEMIGQGWPLDAAVEAWRDYVEVLTEAAEDLALAESAWRAS